VVVQLRYLSCDVVSWNATIPGHVKLRQPQVALELLQRGEVWSQTYKAPDVCANLLALEQGNHAHGQIIQVTMSLMPL
jgi:hypothetical protein